MKYTFLVLLLVLAAIIPRVILAQTTSIQIEAGSLNPQDITLEIYQVAAKEDGHYKASQDFKDIELEQKSKELIVSIEERIKQNDLQASRIESGKEELVLEPGLYYIQPVYKDETILFSALLADPEIENSLQLKYKTSSPADPNKPNTPEGIINTKSTGKEELPDNPDIPLTGTSLYMIPMLVLFGFTLIASGSLLRNKS
jgi:predicted HNH restriction endonuclease